MKLIEADNHSTSSIPSEERLGWKAPLFNFMGVNICMSALMGGGILIQHFTLEDAILISIIANLILAGIAFISGNIGNQKGLSTYIITNQTFGYSAGKYLISMILATSSCGWFGIQTSITALSLQKIYPAIDFTLAAIALGLLMTAFAAVGFKCMALSNYLSIPLLFGLMIWGVYKTLQSYDWLSLLDYHPAESSLSLFEGTNLLIGLFVVSAVVSSDATRYTRSQRDVVIVTGLGMGVICLIQQICASILAINTPTWDITQILADLGFGWSAFAIILLASWSSNIINAYGVGLALKNIFTDVNRFRLTLVAGCIGTFFAASGIINNFIAFLTLLGILIPSIVGVIWVDYYLLQRKCAIQVSAAANWLALAAWLCGACISWITTTYSVGIPAINGIIVSALVYFVLSLYKIRASLPLSQPKM